MQAINLSTPRYTQAEVLAVTGLRAATLQTWLNRGVIEVEAPLPGSGRRRLMSSIDIVKLAVLYRTDALKIDLSVAREIIRDVDAGLREGRVMDWNFYLFVRPKEQDQATIIVASSNMRYVGFNPTEGDPRDMRVSDYVEWFESVLPRRTRPSLAEMMEGKTERPIDPERREALARRGIHAEPVIIFPLGEIVNGALARLRGLEEADG